MYNSGTTCQLEPYKLHENYSKKKEPKILEVAYFEDQMPIGGFCEKSKNLDGVYYKEVKKLPSYTTFLKKYVSKEIELPIIYERGKKMKVVILHNKMIIKTLYFIAADNKWSLVVVDDCNCGA